MLALVRRSQSASIDWVAAIAPGPLPSYVTGLAPASPGHGPQLLLAYEWCDAYEETSVGYGTHRTSGTSNDASYIRLMPLTGYKTRFSAPNGSQNGAG